jgi:hypothetical protein
MADPDLPRLEAGKILCLPGSLCRNSEESATHVSKRSVFHRFLSPESRDGPVQSSKSCLAQPPFRFRFPKSDRHLTAGLFKERGEKSYFGFRREGWEKR